jgi:hypothetical protein
MNIFQMLSCGYAYIIVLNVHIMLQIEICRSKCLLAVDITLLSLCSVKYILTDLSSCPDGIIVADCSRLRLLVVTGRIALNAFCSVLFCAIAFWHILLCSISSYPVPFYSTQFCDVLLHRILFRSILV